MLLEKRDIGLVEDDPIMGESIAQRLVLEGASVTWWRSKQEAVSALAFRQPDAVVCDLRLGDGSGEDLYRLSSERGRTPPFLFMTAFGDIDQAVRLMRAGAGDYLTKPFEMSDFLARLSVLAAAAPVGRPDQPGVSPTLAALLDQVAALVRAPIPALVSGEAGVGKTHFAQLIHNRSANRDEPLELLDCRAFGAELEGRLFSRTGLLDRGGCPTVVLRDVGCISDRIQTRLAEWLRGSVPGLRLLATSTAAADSLLASGRLRSDLRYALAGTATEIPPLRSRRSELPTLIATLLAELGNGSPMPTRRLSDEALAACLSHDWPGNFHELRARLSKAVLLSRTRTIALADLFEDSAPAVKDNALTPLSIARGDAERDRVEHALREAGGHLGKTARRLRISRTTLWAKMKRLGIEARRGSVQKAEHPD
ncbi:hypothetical protein B6S44_27345 [Bosea sp. Tri-44]|uniref:sigma-54-dependent transcriptional regulator n=1 Tax=Bosea sp. Tri-44 TaxID=1972137 RepID=UPI00100D9F4D|nr:response regulator [Bosea sp. Tri-44]RXT45596.1 hypothetical protein B6S44_27345 [Bosea sp. Tri-44]